LLFAAFLYEPSPSLAISDPTSRNHLIWMLIVGIVISDLVARFQARRMTGNRC
jgi:K+-sensing histidine kinase KdpD